MIDVGERISIEAPSLMGDDDTRARTIAALRALGSTATVGSSKKMSSGLCTMPHAMFSRRSRPPESLRGRYVR